VRDDTTSVFAGDWYAGMDAFYEETKRRAEAYEIDKLADQKKAIEVHVEARGMGPQVYSMAAPFSIRVYPAGGYAHLTPKYEIVERIVARYDKQTVILSLGDFDPHGISMFENMADDVMAFVAAEKRPITPMPIFERVALTEVQVSAHQLEHEPYKPKQKDYRGQKWPHDWVVQLEALPPDVLETILTDAIAQHLDLTRYEAARRRERKERRMLLRSLPAPRRTREET
jgi:hypothetical protein